MLEALKAFTLILIEDCRLGVLIALFEVEAGLQI